jgi:hypothetical protein
VQANSLTTLLLFAHGIGQAHARRIVAGQAQPGRMPDYRTDRPYQVFKHFGSVDADLQLRRQSSCPSTSTVMAVLVTATNPTARACFAENWIGWPQQVRP